MAKSHSNTAKSSGKEKKQPSNPGFFQFLKEKNQWIDWAIICGLFVAIFLFLKIYYPFPQTETDSGNYILSAATGKINGYRPYGYSGFLAFFHGFSDSVKFVVTWQWFMTFLSVAVFLFSMKYFFRGLPQWLFSVLCILAIVNPSIIYMDAYLMSDSLFVSLTLLFITTGCWIVYNGSPAAVVLNIILLWMCMDVRYIGLFYPAFSAFFLVAGFWRRFKYPALAAAVIPLALLFLYRGSATEKMKEEFGVETFSSFGGWQKANNAVAMLPHVKVNEATISDPTVKFIHAVVRQFPDSAFSTEKIMATDFMWTKTAPGKQCLFQYIQQTGTPYMQSWAFLGTKMQEYGDYLESNFRGAYFSYFVIPNCKNIFKVYDVNEYPSFAADANLKGFFTTDADNYAYKKNWFKPLTPIRQVADSFLWLLFFSSVSAFVFLGLRGALPHSKLFVLGGMIAFMFAFLAASVYAAPINNFRYLMPVYYIQIGVPFLIAAVFFIKKNEGVNS
ncbi:MAG: hypothetical protein U0T73_01475 [Chitinophagales bacterium]